MTPLTAADALRLYFEKLPDGGYDVVGNDLATSVSKPYNVFPGWQMQMNGVASAIEALTQPLMDDLEHEDDVAGVRVGYQVNGLLAVAFGGEVLCVPDFRLADAIGRLTCGEVAK